MTRTPPPEAPAGRLAQWARQILWFIALWCAGTFALAVVAYGIRAVLFA